MTVPDQIIFKRGDFWVIGRGASPQEAEAVWTVESSDVPKTDWKLSKTGALADIMRVSKVPSTFSREMMNEKMPDLDKDGNIVCTAGNNQRLFIEKNRNDPYFCDKRKHCPKSGLD